MPQTTVEFLNTASRLLPEFDGSPDNLQSFIDALQLVDSIKESHETTAVNLIKTKLRGSARNIISTESTIAEIVSKLKTSIKGESVDVVLAKIMNVRQQGKTANNYAKEIEDLTKKLETCYITDGLPPQVATKYATTAATKAIIKNASNDRVKLIMESGSFSDLNAVISKFVSSCTDAYGQPNSILSFSQNQRQTQQRSRNSFNQNRGFRGNNGVRYQPPRNYTNNSNSNFNRNTNINRNVNYNNTNSNSNSSGNYNANNRNNFRNNRGRNPLNSRVRTMNTDESTENGQFPLDTQ